jgi:hypothetical protein
MSYCCDDHMSYYCNERMSYYCTWGFVKTLGQFNHLDGTQNDPWSCPVAPKNAIPPKWGPLEILWGSLGAQGSLLDPGSQGSLEFPR